MEKTLKGSDHPTVRGQPVASPRLNTSQGETASPAAPAVAVVSSMSATRHTPTTKTDHDNVGRHGWQAKSPCLLCGREPCAPSRTGWQRRRGSQSDLIASGRAERRWWEVMGREGLFLAQPEARWLFFPDKKNVQEHAHKKQKNFLPFL